MIPCERFHEKLAEKNRLLFIFIGEDRIVGSYYFKPYPNIKDSSKILYDADSFLFISPQINYYSSNKSNGSSSAKQGGPMTDL